MKPWNAIKQVWNGDGVVYCFSFKLFPAYFVCDFVVLKSHSLFFIYGFHRVNLQVLFIVEMFSVVYFLNSLDLTAGLCLE